MAAVFGNIKHILDAYTEFVFDINARFVGENHSGTENGVAAGIEAGIFVNFDAYAVTESVTEAALVTRGLDNITCNLVNILANGTCLNRLFSGKLCV